jgi:hypothetical protein
MRQLADLVVAAVTVDTSAALTTDGSMIVISSPTAQEFS